MQAEEGRRGPLVDPVHPSPPLVNEEGEPELVTEESELLRARPVYGEGEPELASEKVETELASEKVETELVNEEEESPPAYEENEPELSTGEGEPELFTEKIEPELSTEKTEPELTSEKGELAEQEESPPAYKEGESPRASDSVETERAFEPVEPLPAYEEEGSPPAYEESELAGADRGSLKGRYSDEEGGVRLVNGVDQGPLPSPPVPRPLRVDLSEGGIWENAKPPAVGAPTPPESSGGRQNVMDTLRREMQGVPLGDFTLQVLANHPDLIVMQPHRGTYFDGTHIVLDPTMPHLDPDTVHETLHFLYDRAGLTSNARELWRDDDVELMLNEETDTQVLGILYNRQWKSKVPGRSRMVKLEDVYERAYSKAYLALGQTDLTAEERELAAHVAGWFEVRQGFANGTVYVSATNTSYPDYYKQDWYVRNEYPVPTPLPVDETQKPADAKGPRVPPPPAAPLVVRNGNQIDRLSLDTWQTYQGYRVPRLPQPQQLPAVQAHAEPTLTKGSKMDFQVITTEGPSRNPFKQFKDPFPRFSSANKAPSATARRVFQQPPAPGGSLPSNLHQGGERRSP